MGIEIGGGIAVTGPGKQPSTLIEFKDNGYVGLLRARNNDLPNTDYDVVYINSIGQCFLVWSFGEAKLIALSMGINSGWPLWECKPFYGNVNISLACTEG